VFSLSGAAALSAKIKPAGGSRKEVLRHYQHQASTTPTAQAASLTVPVTCSRAGDVCFPFDP